MPRENSLDAVRLPVVSRALELIDEIMRQAALYPRWLVITCAVLVGVVALWIVVKLLKWTLILLFTLILLVIVGGVLISWLG